MRKFNSNPIHHLSSSVYKRRRGTAIVVAPQGILVARCNSDFYLLPGGAANRNEPRIMAAIRELKEETDLAAYSARFLFEHTGRVHQYGNKQVQDHHKVFLIEAEGKPKPCHEIKQTGYYQPGVEIALSKSTREILEIYFAMGT